ncbi:MAG: M16 family metallopeptidase [Bacteriovoracia bacterium]
MRKLLILFFILILFVNEAFAIVRFEEDHSLPMVKFSVIFENAGGASDPLKKKGLSNLAAKLLLKGTKKTRKDLLQKKIDILGATLETFSNTDGLILQGTVISQNLDSFLDLVEEIILYPNLSLSELRMTQSELKSQILDSRGSDMMLASEFHLKNLYGKHPYGNLPTGTIKGLSNIYFKDVKDFFAKNLTSQNIHFVGFGDANKEHVQRRVEEFIAKLSWSKPARTVLTAYETPVIFSPNERLRVIFINKPDATQSQVFIGGEGIRPETSGYYSILVGNQVFGGRGFNSRLIQELRVKRGWTYGAANTFLLGREKRHFSIRFFPKTEDTVPAISLALDLLTSWVHGGVKKDEFELAKATLTNKTPFLLDTPSKRMNSLIEEILYKLPKNYHQDLLKNYQSVSYESIAPALAQNVNVNQLVITVLGRKDKILKKLAEKLQIEQKSIKVFHYKHELD